MEVVGFWFVCFGDYDGNWYFEKLFFVNFCVFELFWNYVPRLVERLLQEAGADAEDAVPLTAALEQPEPDN